MRASWRLWGLYREVPRRGAVGYRNPEKVNRVASVTADGSLVALSEGNQLQLCDSRTGQRLHEWNANLGPINSLSFTPDGKYLAIGYTNEGRVQIVEVESPTRVLGEFHPKKQVRFNRPLNPLSAPPSPQQEAKILQSQNLEARALAGRIFIDNQKLLVVDSAEIGILDIQERKWTPIAELGPWLSREAPQILGYRPAEKQLWLRFFDQIEVWQLPSEEKPFSRERLVLGMVDALRGFPVTERTGPTGPRIFQRDRFEVTAAVMSADGKWLVVQEKNGRFRLWDPTTRQKLFDQPRVSESGNVLLSMPRDSSMLLRITESEIEVKKLPELTLTRTIRRLGTRTDFAQMLPDGKSLLLSETQALGIYDLSPPEHTRILSPQASTRRREISRSGPLVILPSNVAEPIELWSNGEKKELSLLGKENRDLNQAQHEALSDDGRYLAISSSSFLSISVKLIDLRERKYLGTIPLGREQAARVLYHLAFSADSTKCLACTDRGVFILDVTGRKVLRQFSFPNQTLVNQVTAQFSPDGQQIAVTVLQSENVLEDLFKPSIWLLSVIDSTTGQVLQKGTEPFQGTLLGWSPDRKYLVTRFEEKTTLWNIATLRREVEIPGGIRAIDSFSPDGKLALLSRGNRLRIWDVARNELLLDFDPEVGPVRQAVFSPDGNLLRLVGDQRSVEIRVDAMNPYLEGNRTWHQERLKN